MSISMLFRVAAFTLASMILFAPVSYAQPYPVRPVKIVVPYPAGGGIDVLARSLAQQLSTKWGKPVVIENKSGSATIAGADTVAKSPPDGYTLLLTTQTTVTTNPLLYAKLPYNAVTDFAPVTQLVQLNQILLTRADVPMSNLGDMIREVKSKPGRYNYASYGSGSEPHLAMEMLKNKAGLFILHVPYRGVPLALSALIGGEVEFTLSGAASSMPHIQSGKLKPLAIGGKTRLALLPQVPTFAELGFGEVPAQAWFGMFAPAGTSPEIVRKIAQDIRAISANPEFQQRDVRERGYEPIFSSPAEFARAIELERAPIAKAIKISGAKVD